VKSFSVVSVPVSDQERAKRFYLDVLGFELIADAAFGDDLRWLQVGPPGAQTTLALVTWFDEMPPGSLRGLVLDTDDIEADYRTLRARGASLSGPPAEQTGGTFCFVKDPDGNTISLHQRTPSGARARS
jgi:catechol 2,3-dioxygenase-like lactoylglutathione lyase family enzyme